MTMSETSGNGPGLAIPYKDRVRSEQAKLCSNKKEAGLTKSKAGISDPSRANPYVNEDDSRQESPWSGRVEPVWMKSGAGRVESGLDMPESGALGPR